MFGWIWMVVVTQRPTAFSPLPPGTAVEQGRRLYRSGVGIDRVPGEDRRSLGTWFDGRIRRTVDSATWVSPELVASWLGYLAEDNTWSSQALAARWMAARRELDGSMTFVVRLAAFPRLDPLEFGIGAPPKPQTLRDARFRLSFGVKGIVHDPDYSLADGRMVAARPARSVRFFEKEEASSVTGRPFYSLTELASLFLGDGEVDSPDDGIQLGDYYGAVYLVSFPLTDALREANKFELRVQLKGKRETARFKLCRIPDTQPPTSETE